MSNLVEHARRELELIGQFDEDPRFAQSIVASVAAFASYDGHSGSSAEIATQMLGDLLRFKNLGALTSNPKEWQLVQGIDENVWQNRRNSEAFSKDGGLNYYLLSDVRDENGELPIHTSKDHKS